jgi:hypothetical protein
MSSFIHWTSNYIKGKKPLFYDQLLDYMFNCISIVILLLSNFHVNGHAYQIRQMTTY